MDAVKITNKCLDGWAFAFDSDELDAIVGITQGDREYGLGIARVFREFRDHRLYRGTHASFDDAVHARWGLSGESVNRFIDAAERYEWKRCNQGNESQS
jgi:hypothetical protein